MRRETSEAAPTFPKKRRSGGDISCATPSATEGKSDKKITYNPTLPVVVQM